MSKKPMHDACIITTIHGDFDNRIYHRQLNSLVDSGFSVCIVAPWNFSKRSRTDFAYVETKMPQSRAARVLHGVTTYLAARKVTAKAYIFHDPDFLPFAWLLKMEKGRRVIYDCHENVPEDILYGKEWIPFQIRGITSFLMRRLENFVVGRLRRSFVVVPNLKRRFEALGSDAILVRNFPGFAMPECVTNDLAVLYTGELTQDYGLEYFLELSRAMKRRNIDAPLRIVDRFRERDDLRKWLANMVETEKLNIEVLQPVLAEEMPQLLAKGCIGLNLRKNLPQHALAYPTKIFEYFMFGLVVVSTDVAGSREILGDGKFGVIVPCGDIEALADAVEQLLRDADMRKHYVEAGRAAVTERYNWKIDEAKMVEYLRTVSPN